MLTGESTFLISVNCIDPLQISIHEPIKKPVNKVTYDEWNWVKTKIVKLGFCALGGKLEAWSEIIKINLFMICTNINLHRETFYSNSLYTSNRIVIFKISEDTIY